MRDYSKEFQTPPAVAQFMVSLIPPGTMTVCEPTKGIGNIASLLQNYDLTAPDDFFLMDHKQRFDCIVMNPPYNRITAILDHAPARYQKNSGPFAYLFLKDCMQMSDHVIALMPWYIFHSDPRMRQIKKFGLKSITSLSRNAFDYIRFQTAVLELHKGWNEQTIFNFFDLGSKRSDDQAPVLF